jgi:hypothetical protein
MRRWGQLLLLLLISPFAVGQIAQGVTLGGITMQTGIIGSGVGSLPVQFVNQSVPSVVTNTNTLTATYTPASASNTIVASIAWFASTGTVTGCTASVGNNMTHAGKLGQGAGGESVDIWAALTAGTTSPITYTCTLSASNTNPSIIISEYSGVSAFGNTNSKSSAITTTYSLGLATQDNNNFVVGAVDVGLHNASFNVTSGNQRATVTNNIQTITADGTSSAPGTVTIAGNTGNHSWSESLLELRSTAPTGGGGGGGGVIGFTPTTTLNALTANNTSASSAFVPAPDPRSGVLTPTYESVPGNVSTVDAHKMMYAGATTEIYANFLDWFSTSGCSLSHGGIGGWSINRNASGNHFCIGYNSADATQVHKQVNDMMARGYTGLVFTWEGADKTGGGFTGSEQTLQLLKTDLEARCTGGICPFKFIIMIDGSELPFSKGFAGTAATPDCCTINSTTTEAEFTAHLKDDICYLNKNYFGSPAYRKLTNGSTTLPMIQSFIIEDGNKNAAAPSWKDLWNNFNTFAKTLSTSCPAFSSVYAGMPNHGVPAMYFGEDSSQFTHDGLTNSPANGPVYGAFTWEQGASSHIGVVGQTSNWSSNISNLSSFYTAGQSHSPSTQTFGAAVAKFNDQLAGWSPNPNNCAVGSDCVNAGRMVDENCAKNWVASWQEPGTKGYSSSNQLAFIQPVTWNDYDEGTEIETGLDNCYSVTSPSIVSSTFSWTMSDSSGGNASTSTIDHFSLWLFDGSGNAMDVLDVTNPNATSLTIPATIPSGSWRLAVQAIGVNSVQNHLSPLVNYSK